MPVAANPRFHECPVNQRSARNMRDQAGNGASRQGKSHLALGPTQVCKVKGDKGAEACLDIR